MSERIGAGLALRLLDGMFSLYAKVTLKATRRDTLVLTWESVDKRYRLTGPTVADLMDQYLRWTRQRGRYGPAPEIET